MDFWRHLAWVPCLVILSFLAYEVKAVNTCTNHEIRSLYLNSCKFKRSHGHTINNPPVNQQSTVKHEQQEAGEEEVLQILLSGLDIVKGSQQNLRNKNKNRIFSNWNLLTNEVRSDEDDKDFESSQDSYSDNVWSLGRVQLWKTLMRDAVRAGGKMRRDATSVIYKCCYSGCNRNDFSHLC